MLSLILAYFRLTALMFTHSAGVIHVGRGLTPLNDVELTHWGLLSSAALIKPLPLSCGGEDGTVLAVAAVGLQGDLCLPVLETHIRARLVHPLAVGDHVVDAQPDVLLGADALPHVVVELLVLLPCQGSAQASSFGDAVLTGWVEGLLHWISQETFTEDLCASQTNWRENVFKIHQKNRI